MKKLLLLLFIGFFTGSVMAQDDETGKLKNSANEALRDKDYKEALPRLETYLKAIDYKDEAAVFNAGFSASKIKNNEAAIKYFDMSIKNNYKLASAYLGKANAEDALNKYDDMVKTLEEGMKALPGQASNLEKKYALYYLKEGQKFQKANNINKAAENYKKITEMSNKGYKSQGLYALGTLYFNNGATIIENSQKNNNYDSEKAKAVAEFKKAQNFLTEAQSVDAANADVKETLKQVKEAIEEHSK